MTSERFSDIAKQIVLHYAIDHLDIADEVALSPRDVYIVWQCYILGNLKALLSTSLHDGMYYEVTYNAKTDDFYLDAYKKWENKCIPFSDIEK